MDTKRITTGSLRGRGSRLFVAYMLDMKAPVAFQVDLRGATAVENFGEPNSLFFNNGDNPNEVEVFVTITDQKFTIPANAQGYFGLDATEKSDIIFKTLGGSPDLIEAIVYNYNQPPVVWYKFGTLNSDKPFAVQGNNVTGTIVDDAEANPVFIAGVDGDGALTPISTDQLGRLRVIGAANGGNVFGTDDDGTLPTAAPTLIAGINEFGLVQSIPINDDGVFVDGRVDIDSEQLNDIFDKMPELKTGVSIFLSTVELENAKIIAPMNPARKGIVINNNTNKVLLVNFHADNPVADLFSLSLDPGDTYIENNFLFTGNVKATTIDAHTGNVNVTELF